MLYFDLVINFSKISLFNFNKNSEINKLIVHYFLLPPDSKMLIINLFKLK